eukprot:1454863-Rhodomonas_salina.1
MLAALEAVQPKNAPKKHTLTPDKALQASDAEIQVLAPSLPLLVSLPPSLPPSLPASLPPSSLRPSPLASLSPSSPPSPSLSPSFASSK